MPVKSTKPKEGSTGWSDTWMISSTAKHPNCMYMWMDYIISPVPNATATVFFGEAPVSRGVRRGREAERGPLRHLPRDRRGSYWRKIYYWNTPSKECIDGRAPSARTSRNGPQAWTEIKG